MSNKALDDSRTLLLEIVKNTPQEDLVAELRGEDAQCIADLLSVLLHEDGAFESEEGQRLFRLLRRLVKSSEVLPRCYELQGIQCDFGRAREGGAFADIFEGEYREQRVCVKAVRLFEIKDNTQLLRAMAKEAILWAHLSHPNILPFYGVYTQNISERICIISPWMSRGDLSAYLKNSPDAPRLSLVLDIVAGLRYLHTSHIVHGDLKAKNILISDSGHCVIADFGISNLTTPVNFATTLVSSGSVPWMAPELLDDKQERQLDGKEECRPTLSSDMWSFGCVCYEVFTGNTPFCDYTNDIQILAVLMRRARRPADASQLNDVNIQDCELMDKCWCYEPDSRASCEEIYRLVVERVGECEQPKVQKAALWRAIRDSSGMAVNYVHARRILYGIGGSHTHKSPHRSTPIAEPPHGSTSTATLCNGSAGSLGLLSNNNLARPTGRQRTQGLSFLTKTRQGQQTTQISPEKLHSKDMIIAVMGPTGVGKSNFIDVFTGQIGKRTGHLLESHTTEVQAIVVENYIDIGANLVLVDTPGFDDTNKPDTEILSMISDWLEKTYRRKIKLTGILYLHRITDNRMGGTPLKNLHVFGKLCGDAAMTRVNLVTTMWDQVQDYQVARGRENELKENFWKTMLELGSRTVRFENTLESAKAIVYELVAERRERETLLLQEELVDLKKRLNETHAGRMLYDALQKLVDEQKASVDKLMEQIESQGNPQLIEGLRRERLKIEEDLQSALDGVRELRVPLSRRILLFLFGKKGKIKPLSE